MSGKISRRVAGCPRCVRGTFHNLKPHMAPPITPVFLASVSSPVVMVGGRGNFTPAGSLTTAIPPAPTLFSLMNSHSALTHVSDTSLASFDSNSSFLVSSSSFLVAHSSRRSTSTSVMVRSCCDGNSSRGGDPRSNIPEKRREVAAGRGWDSWGLVCRCCRRTQMLGCVGLGWR